ncbi:MAG TPA: LON peptidase substrate-binding domain-containing protein [Terriglobales bacterium]|nr:LON peptidase substrate-binding domain-containing protein [Terriglobales bacterium]
MAYNRFVSALLPLFPLDVVMLPGAPLPLHVFEPRYKEMIGEALAASKPFGLVRAKENTIAELGCSAEIIEVTKKYDDGRMDIVAEGRQRFEIVQVNEERTFLQAEVRYFDDDPGSTPPSDVEKLLKLHQELLGLAGAESAETPEADDPQISFHIAGVLPLDLDFKQTLLGMRSEPQRVTALIEYYTALVPQVRRTLKVREKARGNGHV